MTGDVMQNSESRKREAEARAAAYEQRREVMQVALERVYPGADFMDADAVLDQLGDLGASVVVA